MRSSAIFLGLLGLLASSFGCGDAGTDGAVPALDGHSADTAVESATARARGDALRARFQSAAPARDARSSGPPSVQRSVIGPDVAVRFETMGDGGLRPMVPREARHGVARPASVVLPGIASGLVRIEDDTTRLSITFALEGASGAPIAVASGLAVYAGALGGADVVHRAHAEGTEDFVVFEERPATEELRYTIDVSRVAGLRLASNTLEFIDETGAPRLRVAPPSVVDAGGTPHAATLSVEGCAFDTSPVAPWGRAVTSPGSAHCRMIVAWGGVEYPVLVDPAWTATGSMATSRAGHTATLLGSGKVLVAAGWDGVWLASAELYDPGSGTFAATGSMIGGRSGHAATLLGSGKVLIAGGNAGQAVASSAEVYDPVSGMFVATGAMTTPRYDHTATLLGSGKVLVVGGWNGGELQSAELYDPSGAGSFAATSSMTSARDSHTATLLGSGKVLVAGGFGGTGNPFSCLATAELYDPSGAGSFSATGSMTSARITHTATLLGSGKVLLAGGVSSPGNHLASAELYDPSGAGTFASTGSMAVARGYHTATLLGSGKVLVATGIDSGINVAGVELYDPSGAGAFSLTDPLPMGFTGHTATLLGSGKVLVAGGITGNNTVQASALLFDSHAGAGAGAVCGAASECASGACADGVCCDGACSGTCVACSAALKGQGADGQCGPVKAGFDPESECAAQAASTCGQNGSCNGLGTCGLHAVGTICAAASCSGATEKSASTCDGSGQCFAGGTKACIQGYACMGPLCTTDCVDTTACAAGYVCDTAIQGCVLDVGSTSSSSASGAGGSATTSGAGGGSSSSGQVATTSSAGGSVSTVAATSGAGGGSGSGDQAATTSGTGGADGGSGSGVAFGGCGCEVAGEDQASSSLGLGWILALGAMIRLRRRRDAACESGRIAATLLDADRSAGCLVPGEQRAELGRHRAPLERRAPVSVALTHPVAVGARQAWWMSSRWLPRCPCCHRENPGRYPRNSTALAGRRTTGTRSAQAGSRALLRLA